MRARVHTHKTDVLEIFKDEEAKHNLTNVKIFCAEQVMELDWWILNMICLLSVSPYFTNEVNTNCHHCSGDQNIANIEIVKTAYENFYATC